MPKDRFPPVTGLLFRRALDIFTGYGIVIFVYLCTYLHKNASKGMHMQEILDLLQNDARLTADEIAAMTRKPVAEVKEIIAQLESEGVILKYSAIVNAQKIQSEHEAVRAVIEIQVTPEREHGFDALADRIYRFPQVKSLYLMSGGYDLQVIIEGKTLHEVAFFVSEKLATLNGVKSTKTHFVLKTYKENDVVYVDQKKDRREGVTA